MMKLPLTALLAALALTTGVTAQSVDDALTQFRALADQIDSVQRSIDGYNGGVVLALPVANAIYRAHTTATGARTQLSRLAPLSREDSQRALEAYNEIHPRLLRAMTAGRNKVRWHRCSRFSSKMSVDLQLGTGLQKRRGGVCCAGDDQQPV
jgi:malonyl CoA-acyl carrier protein transacylase